MVGSSYRSLIVAASLAIAGVMEGACTSDSCSGTGETFVVFAPSAATSEIPVCTAATASDYDATAAPIPIDGGFQGSFPGAPLSRAAIGQCEGICGQSFANDPCCLSAWEPNTILCPPSCVPQ
jgi:hypothetical protein